MSPFRACVFSPKHDFIAFYSPQLSVIGIVLPILWLVVILRKLRLESLCSDSSAQQARMNTVQGDYELIMLSSTVAESNSKMIMVDEPSPTVNQIALDYISPFYSYCVFGLSVYSFIGLFWLIACLSI